MKEQKITLIKNFTKKFIRRSRLDVNYSLNQASQVLGIDISTLKKYEEGVESPPCNQLVFILAKYQANFTEFYKQLIQAFYGS